MFLLLYIPYDDVTNASAQGVVVVVGTYDPIVEGPKEGGDEIEGGWHNPQWIALVQ